MSFVSRCSVFLALLAVCCVSTIAQNPELQKAVKTCSGQLNINSDQIVAALTGRSPKQEEEKYILQCMNEALGMVSPDGSVNAQKIHSLTNWKKAVSEKSHQPTSKAVYSSFKYPTNPRGRATEITQRPKLSTSSYYDDSEDEQEPSFEPDVLSDPPRKDLHSKISTKNRVRRQSGPAVQQSPGIFRNPNQNFNNPNQQTFPIPNQQNFQNPNSPNQQNYQNPNDPNQQNYQNPNNPNPLLLPFERAISTVRGFLADANNPNGPNQNGQGPFNQNGPFNPNAQPPYNQNGPFNQNGQPPYNQNGPFNQNGQPSLSQNGQTPYNQNGPFNQNGQPSLSQNGQPSASQNGQPSASQNGQPSVSQNGQPSGSQDRHNRRSNHRNQRSKRSPQELVLTSSEITIPAEVVAQVSDRLRRLFMALIASEEARASNGTDSSPEDVEIEESNNRPPRKRRDDASAANQKSSSELPILNMLRERANNGVVHQLVKYLHEVTQPISGSATTMLNQTQAG